MSVLGYMAKNPVDLAVDHASKAYLSRLRRSETSAQWWLDNPESSFNVVYCRILTDEETAQVRQRVIANAARAIANE